MTTDSGEGVEGIIADKPETSEETAPKEPELDAEASKEVAPVEPEVSEEVALAEPEASKEVDLVEPEMAPAEPEPQEPEQTEPSEEAVLPDPPAELLADSAPAEDTEAAPEQVDVMVVSDPQPPPPLDLDQFDQSPTDDGQGYPISCEVAAEIGELDMSAEPVHPNQSDIVKKQELSEVDPESTETASSAVGQEEASQLQDGAGTTNSIR